MTQRERFLSILVGGLLVAVVIWWGFGKYRKSLKLRNNQITMLQNDQQRLVEQQLQGEYANRQMGEYVVRSLCGNPERAQSQYQQWLLGVVQENRLSKAVVDAGNPRPIGGLYHLIDFQVNGNTELPNLISLLHAFYAKDYLHRIRNLSIRESREDDYIVEMSIDVIALLSAPDDLPAREETSWRVDADVAAYLDPILNRNLYEPPNGAPQYTGGEEIEAYVGRETPIPLTFKDPEGHPILYDFVETPPDYVRLDPNSGTLRIESPDKREFEILVRAIDSGYPRRTTEQKLWVKVVDPPSPPPVKPEFDDSTQTVLTALVQGRDEWTAWMHVRTRDTTLRLKVGDGFEIGSLKGKVVGVNARYVTLEIDGRRFELKPAGNLSEAARRAEQD